MQCSQQSSVRMNRIEVCVMCLHLLSGLYEELKLTVIQRISQYAAIHPCNEYTIIIILDCEYILSDPYVPVVVPGVGLFLSILWSSPSVSSAELVPPVYIWLSI